MSWWPSIQRRRIEIKWRNVRCMLSNCSDMSVFGTHWWTWYSLVSHQACTCDHKVDQSLRQTSSTFDLIHLFHDEWIQAICHGGYTAQHCRLGLFQDSDFAGDLEVSKSTSGGTLCTFGSHTFVPVSWVCKKQTCVSHSSTEPQIISLDAGLRMDGIPALDLWDLVIDVLHSNPNQKEKLKKEREDRCTTKHQRNKWSHSVTRRCLRSKLSCRMLILFPQTWILLIK